MLSAIFKRTAAGVIMDKAPTKLSVDIKLRGGGAMADGRLVRSKPFPEENVIFYPVPNDLASFGGNTRAWQAWHALGENPTFYAYAFDTAEHAETFRVGRRAWGFQQVGSGESALTEIWRAKWVPKGAIALYYFAVDKSLIFIDMMSVKPTWQQRGINWSMILRFKKEWPKRGLAFSKTTPEGQAFVDSLRAAGHKVLVRGEEDSQLRRDIEAKRAKIRLSGLAFAGLLSGADSSGGIEGRIVRAANKWFFVTRFAGQSFRYVFDTSAEHAPEVGPAVLYGAIGTNSLAAVFQHGRAVGWFRGDQRATVRRAA